jgi:hypothetical protein
MWHLSDCHRKKITLGIEIKSNGPEPMKIAMPTLLLFEAEMVHWTPL